MHNLKNLCKQVQISFSAEELKELQPEIAHSQGLIRELHKTMSQAQDYQVTVDDAHLNAAKYLAKRVEDEAE